MASGLFVGFLCLVCLVAYLVPRKFRYVWLLLCSYGFYLYDAVDYTRHFPAFGLLLAATAISYGCAWGIGKSQKIGHKRIFLAVTILSCLAMLIVCKYTNFFAETIEQITHLFGGALTVGRVSLVLPLGISYYTLQTISYSIDVYKGKLEPEKNPLRYALYVSFFPGIVTGPINRATAMLQQYKRPQAFSYDRLSGGLFRVLWGFVKKLVIADHIGVYTAMVFGTPGDYYGPHLVLAVLLFSYQLYADFSGSCDIAIGAARMLGFDFMENFNRPFADKTFAGLWRRWHISLTSFFKDYVYIPLGGNRVSLPRWMFNSMVVFVVSAFWHGAGIGYLIWGFLNGAVLIIGKLVHDKKEKLVGALPLYRKPRVRGIFQRGFVYLLFSGCFAFFAFSLYNTPIAEFFSMSYSGWRLLTAGKLVDSFADAGLPVYVVLLLAVGILLVELIEMFAVKKDSTVASWIRTRKWYLRWPLYYLLLCALITFGKFGQSSFIYQQY
ncbi:hypothetical protein LJC49_08045 [Ruminococcaceae bacterium OttesenSCG-928-I18]|nr:hypothetical protein [Ruminococcaceae bacterium OttesenSCG-928-I18]